MFSSFGALLPPQRHSHSRFQEKLNLEQWQSQMVSFAFYVAYTVGSLIYFGVSKFMGGDLLNKIGYKMELRLGLLSLPWVLCYSTQPHNNLHLI